MTKSIVYPKCGCCSPGKYWTYWICASADCQLRVELPKIMLDPKSMRQFTHPLTAGYAFSDDWWADGVTMGKLYVGNYYVRKYTLPGLPDSPIFHLHANKTVVEEPGGPGDMFRELQEREIGLERRDKGDTRIKGESLCDHFTVNYGMPYKFVASPHSKPFSEAPQAVRMARSQMTWSRHTVGIQDDHAFDECMLLAYKDGCTIGYHDDGEVGLGPTVSSLSLGSPAVMSFKMQEKQFRGFTGGQVENGKMKNKLFVDERPPIPGSNKFEERSAAYKDLQELRGVGSSGV